MFGKDPNRPRGWVHPNVRPPKTRRATVHQMKITLREVRPAVWRRVVIPSTCRLDEVAETLLAAMGWMNSHLHAFTIGDLRYDMVGPYSEGDELDEQGFTLRDVFDEVGRSMLFEYDFGDGWEHTVLLEAVRLQTKAEAEPLCVAGKRACPPEDCGGPHGYRELLELREHGPRATGTGNGSNGSATSTRMRSISTRRPTPCGILSAGGTDFHLRSVGCPLICHTHLTQ